MDREERRLHAQLPQGSHEGRSTETAMGTSQQNSKRDSVREEGHSEISTFHRPTAAGKFLVNSGKKLWIRGVTYGTFRPGLNGDGYPDPATAESDLSQIAANGLNALRTYTVPPRWLLDLAYRHQLRIMVGLPWEQHVAFLEDQACARRIEERVRAGVRACAGHSTILCYAIGNEIPAPIVRWYGRRAVERYLERLYHAAKEIPPLNISTCPFSTLCASMSISNLRIA